MLASRLCELEQALDVSVQYFFDGIITEDEAVLHIAIAEDTQLSPFLDFVSSGQDSIEQCLFADWRPENAPRCSGHD